jgi:hypothetical protein
MKAFEVVAIQTAELRMEEDEGADRPAESHHGNEDLPGSNPTGFPEDGRDEQSDDRAPEGECRSHRSEDSLDLPRADSLDPIRPAIDIHSCEGTDILDSPRVT